jgi:hypothetical protein
MPTFGKVFDLHFEIGTNGPPSGNFYARTIIGTAGLIIEADGPTPAVALGKLAIDMENNNLWAVLAANPHYSSYPLGSNSTSAKPQVVTKKPDPNIVRKKPMELTQVTHPDCQMLCTSFDHFGKTKCKSMCGQRTGL